MKNTLKLLAVLLASVFCFSCNSNTNSDNNNNETDIPSEDTDNPDKDADNPGEDTDNPGEDTDNPGEDTDNPGEDTDNPGEDTDNPGDKEDDVPSTSSNIEYTFDIPAFLSERKLSDLELQAISMEDPEKTKESISTIGDAIYWVKYNNKNNANYAGWWCNSPDSYYRYFPTPKDAIYSDYYGGYSGRSNNIGFLHVSQVISYLVDDDFENNGLIIYGLDNCDEPLICSYFLKGDYYYIQYYASDCGYNNWFQNSELYNIRTKSLDYLSELVNSHSSILKIININDINKKIIYYKIDSSFDVLSLTNDTKIIYKNDGDLDIEDYIMNTHSSNEISKADINIENYKLPGVLSKTTLTLDEAKALVGKTPEEVKEGVKTVGDMLLYMYYSDFVFPDSGDMSLWDKNNNVGWHFNSSARTNLILNQGNCGGTANVAVYLLEDDYKEIGYISQTYLEGHGGGHVYNYLYDGEDYYVFDMTVYSCNNYSSNLKSALIMYELSDYANNYQNIYGQFGYDDIPLIYSYLAKEEIPMAWGGDCYTTYHPIGSKINIIREDTTNGYSHKFINLSNSILSEINSKRRDLDVFSLDGFPGINYFNVPSVFGVENLSDKEILKLKDSSIDEVASKIRSVSDLIKYLYAAGFTYNGGKDICIEGNGGQAWHFNYLAKNEFKKKSSSCGAIANIVQYLLLGDYDEVGIMNHIYRGDIGGHVYNYIKTNNKYYVFDLDNMVCSNYAYRFMYVDCGNSLNNYSKYYANIYTDIGAIYSCSLLGEVPLSWDIFDGLAITKLPLSVKDSINITNTNATIY